MTESNRIEEQAALWVIRHHSGPLAEADQREFEAWIAADMRHQGAFVRLNAVRVDLPRLVALSAGNRQESSSSAIAESRIRLTRRWAIAAGVACVALGAGAALAWLSRGEEYVSGVGERRQISFEDGSSMLLNTASETRVRFSESVREVRLARGEALFEVAKDPARPFVVHAGDVTVTAVGTAFTVRAEGGRVDVTVTEGVVELAQADVSAPVDAAPRRVSANQHAIVTSARPAEVRSIEHEEAERRLAWRTGMVAFKGEPLAEAVAEVNRHNRRHIVVDDASLAGRPVVGMFRTNDVETFARTAAAVVGGEVVVEGELIRLRTRAAE